MKRSCRPMARRHKTGSRRRDLPHAARRRHAGALMDPDARRRITASSSPTTKRSRSPTISPLRDGRKAIYRPTCHYAYHPSQRRGAVAARDVRQRRQEAVARRTFSMRTRSSTASTNWACCSTAQEERLLVWLAAVDRGGPRARALSERHRPAGDERRCLPG